MRCSLFTTSILLHHQVQSVASAPDHSPEPAQAKPAQMWKFVQQIKGQASTPDNQDINFQGKPYTDPNQLSNMFCKQFVPPSNRPKGCHKHRKIRRTAKLRLDDAPTINPEDVEQAIKRAKPSKAAGPDEITSLHLKKLGPLAVSYLCNTFQLSLSLSLSTLASSPPSGESPTSSLSPNLAKTTLLVRIGHPSAFSAPLPRSWKESSCLTSRLTPWYNQPSTVSASTILPTLPFTTLPLISLVASTKKSQPTGPSWLPSISPLLLLR